jgi:two-component system, sensor histidine kinase LadS
MKIKKILKLLLLLTLVFTNLYAQAIIDKTIEKTSILENSEIFIDKTSSLTFEEIQQKEFIKLNTDYIRLGYTSDTLWVKFSIKNNSNENLKKYITLSNPMLDTIELYTKQDDNSFKKETQGVLHLDLYERNNILHPSFEVNFNANETKEFYYKTYSLSCANYFKLFIKDEKILYKDEFSYQLVETLLFGAMIAFIVYNIFIFIFTKEIAYLYYVLYLFFVTLNHSSYSIMLDYILGEKYSHIDAYLAIYYLSFASIFAFLFIKNILNINRYKVLNIITNIFIILNILLMMFSSINNYLIEYSTHLMFVGFVFVIYLTIFSLIKKHPLAKYIFLAWIINIIGFFSLAFKEFGIPNPIDYFTYFFELTIFIEAILFSIALASKLNKTKELENSLKTNKILLKELHHRVKNNMQFIIIMYRLKLANFSTPQVEQKIDEIEDIIQAMSKTHEILYNQENLEQIDTKEYFENLIEKIKKTYKNKKVKINIYIQTNIDIQTSIYLGIILNELLTNSFKYAFTKDNGNIKISLEKEDSKTKLIYKDDGVGFDYEDKKDESFGLTFIESIIKNELKGDLKFKNEKGIKVTINF